MFHFTSSWKPRSLQGIEYLLSNSPWRDSFFQDACFLLFSFQGEFFIWNLMVQTDVDKRGSKRFIKDLFKPIFYIYSICIKCGYKEHGGLNKSPKAWPPQSPINLTCIIIELKRWFMKESVRWIYLFFVLSGVDTFLNCFLLKWNRSLCINLFLNSLGPKLGSSFVFQCKVRKTENARIFIVLFFILMLKLCFLISIAYITFLMVYHFRSLF